MAAPLHHQRGFTLFELLLVIVLIGVATPLLAIGISRGLHSAQERTALANMVSALRSARMQAIGSGQPVRAGFDLQRREVHSAGHAPARWPEDFSVRLHTAEGLGAAFEFYPDGAASGGNIQIARGERHWRIDVGWLTGRVTLKSLP
ncbi:general secretion pathway protein GspH [Pseudomonas sp. LB-090624]|uniref:GspH/FimT family pseudopilin n=1 Tax=unclassified Pseudomonas TaxID=196821 RepID=UPI000D85E0F8|nr:MULTISPECIES: GspH/FimT family pseudopilin [unclassified Pseudomonas]MCX2890191.1 GspH/FimT family pseudopilin [Pseudomonas sp. DCB_BI]MDH4552171.1 prepilin-type N-terminal cleavage/methylation domain-containing protein [Pseudomonas sp. BN607]PYB80998.1 general secretion pathway protein GspH [Pseudomonas sp. LB-090624]